MHATIYGERKREQKRQYPKAGDNPQCALQAGNGQLVQGVTDGQVPLGGEGHNRQHGDVGGPGTICYFFQEHKLCHVEKRNRISSHKLKP